MRKQKVHHEHCGRGMIHVLGGVEYDGTDYIALLIATYNLYFVSYFWTFSFSISRLY